MSESFDCPLWKGSLSLESGLKRRICCHDETASSEDFSGDLSNFKILEEINTSIALRKVPKYCKGCHLIEKNNGYSPRNYYQDFFKNESDDNSLRYIDVTFENICNLSCFSCKPIYSNKIENEFKKLNIPFEREGLNAQDFKQKFDNFKEIIIKKLSKDSLVVISGGEPSISKNVKEFLNTIAELKHSNTITVRVFTNLTMPNDWILSYLDKFKKIELVLSIDAIGDRAEYIRFPSNWKKIDHNFHSLVENTSKYQNVEINIHSVLSILNLDHLPYLIDYFHSSKLKIVPRFTLITSPTIYKVENLSKETLLKFKNKTLEYLETLEINSQNKQNINDLKSIVTGLNSSNNSQLLELMIHHKRIDTFRNTNLLDEITYIK